MKLVRSLAFSLSLAAGSLALVACAGSVEQPQSTATAATKAPITTHGPGVVKLVGDALGDVPLRAEQRTEIDKLVADSEARHAPLAAQRKELLAAFAEQVEKGAIDKAALKTRADKLSADFETIATGDRAAFVKLHDLLDASQRNAFVDAVEAQMKAKHGERREHGFGKLHQLQEELKLSDAQKAQIHDVMRDAHKEGKEAWKEHARGEGPGAGGPGRGHHGHHGGKGALEAFREEKLDLDKALPGPAGGGKAHAQLFGERAASFAEKIVPILTPEQRKIAADKLRAMAESGDDALLAH